MAYEKQTQHTGDVITEGKLNHMEDGIANAGALVIHMIASETPPEWVTELDPEVMTYAGYYFDVTPKMLHDADESGKTVILFGEIEDDGDVLTNYRTSMVARTIIPIPPEEGSPYETQYMLAYSYNNAYNVGNEPAVGYICSFDENNYYAGFLGEA